ncbi:MAG TPA: phage integrase N-terminal domain-containing protein [Woeseiaceae bacterium]|nr:phage integrase N-terminal domain-containing protein [Woeseiaceae bacterium]
MRRLNHQLKQLCKYNRDGSYGTQVQRERQLTLIANQLFELGFRQMQAKSLRPKHVEGLVRLWLDSGIAAGTMKNRMAALRWWAGKVNKQNVVARSNDHYGLLRRQYVNGAARVIPVLMDHLEKITDPYVKMSLELQQAFGLRREEAIKIRPRMADKGDTLWLKASWTKGGRARDVPIRNERQREILDRARALAGAGSLIPADTTYIQQLKRYEGQCIRAGLSRAHRFRHGYAQERYRELTGWEAPAAGGPAKKSLSLDQRAQDISARQTIARELGHGRVEVSAVYLGR